MRVATGGQDPGPDFPDRVQNVTSFFHDGWPHRPRVVAAFRAEGTGRDGGAHMKKLLLGPTAWLRLADKLDYFIRRWLIPLRIEG